MSSWIATDLSVSPAYRQMADTDIETFEFDAGQAITGATTAVLTDLDADDEVNDLITNTSIVTPLARFTIAGLTRGRNYELAVTMVNSAGRRWTRTLVIECKA